MLTTLLRPTAGSARVAGHDVVREAARVRERISYVPQDMAVDIKLTGRENVSFYAALYGVPGRDRVDEVLGIMDLADRADDLTGTYSGGMRRRLELAQALVHEPEVLFLDEPTIGLDVAGRRAIWTHITELRRRGMTVFVTTHYMDEADQACDRVGVIAKGRLVAVDAPAALRHRLGGERIVLRTDRPAPPVAIDGTRLVSRRGRPARLPRRRRGRCGAGPDRGPRGRGRPRPRARGRGPDPRRRLPRPLGTSRTRAGRSTTSSSAT